MAAIPKGKWVKATKVKYNANGTVSVMVPGSSLKKKAATKKRRKATTKLRKR